MNWLGQHIWGFISRFREKVYLEKILTGTTDKVITREVDGELRERNIKTAFDLITSVTAGNGLSGGGTSGDVTLAINTAITVDKNTTQTLTNKTLTLPVLDRAVLNTSVSGSSFQDDDLFSAASSVKLASSESIKAYVDTSVASIPKGLKYQGLWNASTNSPTLQSGVGVPGYYYIVSVQGTTNLDGITDWNVGDWAIFTDHNTDHWQRLDQSEADTLQSVTQRGATSSIPITLSAALTGTTGTFTGQVQGGNLKTTTGNIISSGNLILSTAGGSNIELYTNGNAYYDAVSHVFRDSDASPTYFNITSNFINSTVKLVMDSTIDMNNNKITELATPTISTDAATKGYVDGQPGLNETLQNVTDNGNTTTNSIMIGSSSSPSNKLDVQDTGATYVARFRGSNSSYVQSGESTLSGESGFLAKNSSGALFIGTTGGVAYFTGTSGANTMTFGVGGSEKMRLLSTGNLGIGTTAPGGKLQIDQYTVGSQGSQGIFGNVSSFSNSGSTNLFLGIKNSTYPNRGWAFNPETNGVNSDLVIKEYGFNGERFRIKTGGNIGIGTTAPTEKLQVDGNVKISLTNGGNLQFRNGSTANALFSNAFNIIGAAGSISDFNTYVYGNNPYSIWTNNTNRLSVTGAGNVGIATTAPSKRLDVRTNGVGDGIRLATSSNLYFAQIINGNSESFPYGIINLSYGSTTPVRISALSNELQISGGYTTGGKISFRTASTERMRLTDTGLGIGNTAPSQALHITGNMRLTGAFRDRVNSQGAAGYILKSTGSNGTEWIDPATLPGNADTLQEVTDNGATTTNSITFAGGTSTGALSGTSATFTDDIKTTDEINWGNNSGSYVGRLYAGAQTAVVLNTSTAGALQLSGGNATSNGGNIGLTGSTNSTPNLIKFRIGGAEAMRVSAGRSLMIGTSTYNSAYKLDVNGNVRVGTNLYIGNVDAVTTATEVLVRQSERVRGITPANLVTAGGTGVFLPLAGGILTGGLTGTTATFNGNVFSETYRSSRADGDVYIQSATASDFVAIGTQVSGQSNLMRIIGNGNVLIGTTSDTGQKLQVSGDIYTGNLKLGNGETNASIQLDGEFGGGDLTIQNLGSDQDIYFKVNDAGTSNTPLSIIGATSNVGVGTVSPSATLHVKASNSGASAVASGTLIIEQGSAPSIQILSANSQQQNIKFGDPQDGDVGRITYSHASNFMSFTANGSEAARITSTGNVGIGTTNPSDKLHVNGNVFAQGNLTAYGGSSESSTISSTGFIQLRNSGNTNVFLRSNGASYFNGGNFGIGTTSPSHKLTINSTNNTTAFGIDFPSAHFDFSANSTSGYTSNFRINDVGMDIGHDSTARALNLQTGNLDRLTILGNGNIGIGTTAPTVKLGVVGDVLFQNSNAPNLNLYRSGTGQLWNLQIDSSGRLQFKEAASLGGTKNLRLQIDDTGEVEVYNNLTGTTATFTGKITISDNQYLSWSTNSRIVANSSYMQFQVAATDKMRILANGNVGIGTTSPAHPLQVQGRISTDQIQFTDSNALIYRSSNHLLLQTYAGYNINLLPSNNVGIGTQTPSAKLDVVGTGKFSGQVTIPATPVASTDAASKSYVDGQAGLNESLQDVTDNGATTTNDMIISNGAPAMILKDSTSSSNTVIARTQFLNNVNTEVGQVGFLGDGNLRINNKVSSKDITFFTANAERMRISSTGIVGIGTTVATSQFTVASDNSTRFVFGGQYSSSNHNRFFEAGIVANDGYLKLRNSGVVETIKLNSDGDSFFNGGNVLIGTTTASGRKLSIEGNAELLNSNELRFYNTGNTNWGQIKSPSSGVMEISTGGGVAMTLLGNGNVGVGTSSPTEKLDVSGNVKASRVISNIIRDSNGNGHLTTTVTNASTTSTVVGNTGTATTLTLGVKSSGGVVNIPNGLLTGINSTFSGTVTANSIVGNVSVYTGGILYGGSTDLQLRSNSNELFADFANNGAATLYHDNSAKFQTSATGAKVLGALDLNTNKINNLVDPTSAQDAATKNYVDEVVSGVLVYQGVWNAATNSPALASGVGVPGYYYIVSVAGSTSLDGISDWKVGDWAIFTDQATDKWQKIDHTNVLNGAGQGNKITKWAGSGTSYTLTDSLITDDGSSITLGGNLSGTIASFSGDINTTNAFNFTSNNGYIKVGTAWNTGVLHFLNGATTYLMFDVPNNRIQNNLGKYLTASGSVGQFGTMNNYGTAIVANNSEKMRITPAGKVGVGTTSPSEKFSVSGNMAVPNGSAIMLGGAVGDTKIGKLYNVSGVLSLDGDGTRSIRFGSTTNGEVMRVDNTNQRIGIGTASPAFKLDVNGVIAIPYSGSNSNYFRQGNSLGYGYIYPFDNTGSFCFDSYYNHGSGSNYKFKINTVEKMRLTSGGNLGIGTTSPTKKLEVSSSAQDIFTFKTSFNSGNYLEYAHNRINSVSSGGNSTLALQIDGTSRATINASGLTVAGTIGSGPITSTSTITADTYFQSSDAAAVLAPTGAGTVYLRPNGIGSGTGAFSVSSSGKATVSGELEATSLDINGNADISGALTLGTTLAVAEGGTGLTANTTYINSNSFANFLATNADLDTLTTRGLYRFQGGANGPFSGTHSTGFALTENSGNYGFQLATKGSGNNQKSLAYRYRGTSWEDWQYLVTETYGDGRYATTAQGTLATNALPKSGGAMSGTLVMGGQQIKFSDSGRLFMGDSNDLEIFHNGGNSFIKDTGVGDLYIDGSQNVFIRDASNGQVWLQGNAGGVNLRYQDNVKIATTNTGISITGVGVFSGQVTIPATPVANTDAASKSYVDAHGGGLGPFLPLSGGTLTGNLTTAASLVSTNVIIDNIVSKTSGGNIAFKANNGADLMRLTSGGNLGIGTTSPAYKLDVNGTGFIGNGLVTNTAIALRLKQAAGILNDSTEFRTGGGDFKIFSGRYNNAHQSFTWATGNNYVSGATRMTLTAGGNLGIGTTAPNEKLNVYGSVSLSTGNAFKMYNSAGNGWGELRFDESDNRLQFNRGIQNSGADFLLSENSVNSYVSANQGNFGIGTTTPSAKLQVVGGNLRVDSTGSTADYSEITDRQFQITRSGSSSGMEIETLGTYTGDGGFIDFNPKNATAMRIAGNGNVGLGTTTPIAAFQVGSITATAMSQVVGKARIVGTDYAPSSTQMGTLDIASTTRSSSSPFNVNKGPSLSFSQNISGFVDGYEVVLGAIKTISRQTGNTGQEAAMTFLINGGTSTGVVERMRIEENGNVGIGTAAPSDELEVYKNGSDVAIRIHEDAGTHEARLHLRRGGSDWELINNNNFTIEGEGNERFRIDTAGNVGIGTTSPSEKLHVNGNALIASGGLAVGTSLVYNGSVNISNSGQYRAGNTELLSKSGSSASIYQGKLIVTNPGDVGIGTNTPITKLEVNGAITAGGKISYKKSASSLSTTGYIVAGLNNFSGGNGQSTTFTFTCGGGAAVYQKVIIGAFNSSGTWSFKTVINEGTNQCTVTPVLLASGAVTFTFKSLSGSLTFTPHVHVEIVTSDVTNSLNLTYI